jgi:Kef-type K+ transport system membrane component KefB
VVAPAHAFHPAIAEPGRRQRVARSSTPRAFGEVAERIGQPALVGELLSGIAIGLIVTRWESAFPVLSDLEADRVFRMVTDLGIFFLMLLAGIKMHPRDLARSSGSAIVVASGGMALPLVLGALLGWIVLPASPYKAAQALFVGTALAVTAVPVSVRVLMDLGRLHTRMGRLVVSAAIFDDILSLVLLAVLTGILKSGGGPAVTDLLLLFCLPINGSSLRPTRNVTAKKRAVCAMRGGSASTSSSSPSCSSLPWLFQYSRRC